MWSHSFGWRSCIFPTPGPFLPQTSRLWLLSLLKIPGAPTSVELKIQGHGSGVPGEHWSPHPSVLMFCPAYASHMTPSEGSGDVETKEDGEERYPGRTGKAGRKKDVRWQRQEVAVAPPRAAVDSSPGPGRVGVWAAEDNFASSPRSCPPPALRCAAPRPPSRGAGAGSCGSPPGRPPPRPPASSPSGPERATGQRSPESGPGCVRGGAVLPRASCARVSQRPPELWRHQLLRGCRAIGPGLRGLPGAECAGRRGGSGAGSRRKHPAT